LWYSGVPINLVKVVAAMMRLVMEATMVIAIVSILVFLTKISANEKTSANTGRDEDLIDHEGDRETPENDSEKP
jgi:hypothetical protein